MKWCCFIETLRNAEKEFREMERSFPQYNNFLKNSCLEIEYFNRHVSLKETMSILGFCDHLWILKESPAKKQLVDLLNLYKMAKLRTKGERNGR